MKFSKAEDASLWISMDVHKRCHTEEENLGRLVHRHISLVLMPVHQLFVEYLLYAKCWKYSSEKGKCRLCICRTYGVDGTIFETC